MEQNNGHVNNLLEESWFFGNSLLSQSKSSKMVRCNSDPCPSSSTKEQILVSQNPSKMSNLFRTPSLPPFLGGDRKYEQENEDDHNDDHDHDDVVDDDEEDEPSMGDLIRQAMPSTCRRLDRTPSLPPCRGTEGPSSVQFGAGVGRLTRRMSIDSPVFLPEKLPEKGPIGMIKLTRRASIDSSLVLPPKYSSKGTKQGIGKPQRKVELPSIKEPNKNLDNIIKSHKSLSEKEIMEELQGFKDLNFSSQNKKTLPTLQRKGSIDSNYNNEDHNGKLKRPNYPSEAWRKPSSPLSTPPPVPKWDDEKPSSVEDMKAQIKFWARAVASNVRQEC